MQGLDVHWTELELHPPRGWRRAYNERKIKVSAVCIVELSNADRSNFRAFLPSQSKVSYSIIVMHIATFHLMTAHFALGLWNPNREITPGNLVRFGA